MIKLQIVRRDTNFLARRIESQYQVMKLVRGIFLSLTPRASFLPFFGRRLATYFAHCMIGKNCSCFAEQNRKTPAWILKPLIDPRDKTLPAWNENIVRSSKPTPS
jgi:hypothetical protein